MNVITKTLLKYFFFTCLFIGPFWINASDLLQVKSESYSYKIQDLETYTSTIVYEGFNADKKERIIPISVLEFSELESLELFIGKKGKWKQVNIDKRITISTISYSTFFSGSKNYFVKIPPFSKFKVQASVKEKHSIFLSEILKTGYFESDSVGYNFSLPPGIALSTSDGHSYTGDVSFTSSQLESDKISMLVHPADLEILPFYSSWFNERILPQLEIDDSFVPQSLVELSETGSRKELAEACFNFVTKTIKYIDIENGINAIIPRRCEAVLENRYGDCKDMATLLTAILRHFNFEAYPSISRTNSKDGIFNFPSLALANHMICSLYLEGEWYFLDPTEDACLFGDPSSQIMGTEVFLVGNSTEYFIDVPDVPRSKSSAQFNFRFNESKKQLEFDFEVSGKLNVLFYSLKLKEKEPSLIIERIFNSLTDLKWQISNSTTTDEVTRVNMSTPINSTMFSSFAGRRMYDLSFVPTVKMINAILFNSKYPTFTTSLSISIEFDGRIHSLEMQESDALSAGVVNENELNVQIQLNKYKDLELFEKSELYSIWNQVWDKPILVE